MYWRGPRWPAKRTCTCTCTLNLQNVLEGERLMAGFECEFVERPPRAFQVECPICLLILREPYQVTCCGKSFCGECIQQVKDGYQVCPTCNNPDFNLFHNLGLEQSLYNFRVYCTHKSKGCEWTGELRELDNHVNTDPPADKALEGCPFTVISCPLSHAGCEVKVSRKDMSSHFTEGVVVHTLLHVAEVQHLHQETQVLKSRVHLLENKNRRLEHDMANVLTEKSMLHEHVTDLEEKVKLLSGDIHTFTMANFFKYRHEHKEWSSIPFYTHTHGYKMCLLCDASAPESDSHLSVYVCLMQGEFDDYLRWPFQGEMTVHLLDQSGTERHCNRRVTFDGTASDTAINRVKKRLKASIGIGFPQFIPLSELHPRYLKNDCLSFKITDIRVK